MVPRDAIIHYDSLELDELAHVLKCDWDIDVGDRIVAMPDASKWNLVQTIRNLDNSIRNNVGIQPLEFLDPNGEATAIGVALMNCSLCITLDFRKASILDIAISILSIEGNWLTKSNLVILINLLRKIVLVKRLDDGSRCVLNNAISLQGAVLGKTINRNQLNPWESEGYDRKCKYLDTFLSCVCREDEDSGCQLREELVEEIIKQFSEDGIFEVNGEDYRLKII